MGRLIIHFTYLWFRPAAISLFAVWIALAGPLYGESHLVQGTEAPIVEHLVMPGDTWQALAWRYDLPFELLTEANLTLSYARSPAIGSTVQIPSMSSTQRLGEIVRLAKGGLIYAAASKQISPWTLALVNGRRSPLSPIVGRTLFVPGGSALPREYPHDFNSLETSPLTIEPGRAFAVRASVENVSGVVDAEFGSESIAIFINEGNLIGLGATGAFFEPGDHELRIITAGTYIWSQPWRMAPGHWDFQEITLTGSAAQIDQASIIAERARLDEIWRRASPEPAWSRPFQVPIVEYLSISSSFGARRSYNGGPYRTYHEGLDFSAYGGTPVFASGDGRVVLAEQLYVRGGAVIIDHGLGVFSGYYHLSEINVTVGSEVSTGDAIGKVGTTGLSTGNHLHWDVLAGGTWVDPQAWLEEDLACWLLETWAGPCSS